MGFNSGFKGLNTTPPQAPDVQGIGFEIRNVGTFKVISSILAL